MRPIVITGAEPKPLGQPADWDEAKQGPCAGLFVRREIIDGVQYMRSAWEIEPREAALLYAGGRLTLGVSGNVHPVIQLGIADVPPDFEPVIHARQFTHATGRPCVRVEMLFPHNGGSRGFIEVAVDDRSLPEAMAYATEKLIELAKAQGWIE